MKQTIIQSTKIKLDLLSINLEVALNQAVQICEQRKKEAVVHKQQVLWNKVSSENIDTAPYKYMQFYTRKDIPNIFLSCPKNYDVHQ